MEDLTDMKPKEFHFTWAESGNFKEIMEQLQMEIKEELVLVFNIKL